MFEPSPFILTICDHLSLSTTVRALAQFAPGVIAVRKAEPAPQTFSIYYESADWAYKKVTESPVRLVPALLELPGVGFLQTPSGCPSFEELFQYAQAALLPSRDNLAWHARLLELPFDPSILVGFSVLEMGDLSTLIEEAGGIPVSVDEELLAGLGGPDRKKPMPS
jgi:hypothetical protein